MQEETGRPDGAHWLFFGLDFYKQSAPTELRKTLSLTFVTNVYFSRMPNSREDNRFVTNHLHGR